MTIDNGIAYLATELGWPFPEKFVRPLPAEKALPATKAVWYECEVSDSSRLVISTYYAAAVYALRYRLFTGWHPFVPHRSKRKLDAEVQRLKSWLDYQWFATIQGRREFRAMHPDWCGYTLTRLRQEKPKFHS